MPKTRENGASQAASRISLRGRPREFDRDEAVRKAMELFWKKGYMQTTLGDLCQELGISPPSFYCAFRTREDLFLETVDYYVKTYWGKALERLAGEKDIYAAVEGLFTDAVRIYMRHGLSNGCFVDISIVGLSSGEMRIINALEAESEKTREFFRRRLMQAIEEGQIAPDSDIPAITGSLMAFVKGIAALARGSLCQSELMEIARQGIKLMPPRKTGK